MRNKKYWEKELGAKWTIKLASILRDPYMEKLMNFLDVQFAMHQILPSERKDLFKTFKLLPFDKIKCVIIVGPEFSFNPYYNGLPYSEKFINVHPNRALCTIESTLDVEYGFNANFDYSMEHLVEQGVFFFNTALSTTRINYFDHVRPWNKFTNAVIEVLSKELIGVPVIIWGDSFPAYKDYFKNQNVYHCEDPGKAALEYREWICSNFKEIDQELININGEHSTINWFEN